MAGRRARLRVEMARQLGHPSGLAGRVVARGLDRGNRHLITEAVQALDPPRRPAIADFGFGGGLGIKLSLNLVIGIGDPDAMGEMAFTEHGFRLRPVDEICAAFARTGVAALGHRRAGDSRIPGHVLIAENPIELGPVSD